MTDGANSGDPRVVALISDLMVATQIESSARMQGRAVEIVASAAALARALTPDAPQLFILDLTDTAFPFRETYTRIREAAPTARIIAFYPHVRDDLRHIAQEAGCETVMPRSRFLTNPAQAIALAGGLTDESRTRNT
jgi:DNA-binding NarL/FixJ family response regulator